MELPVFINWMTPFPILGVLGDIFHFSSNFKKKLLFGNSGQPDQMPHSAASELVLHCLKGR